MNTSTNNQRKCGGQYTIGTFGSPRAFGGVAVAPPVIPATLVQRPNPEPKPSRIKGALQYFDRDGLSDAHCGKPSPVARQVCEFDDWDEYDNRARHKTTPAMRAAAQRSTERERRPLSAFDQREEALHRSALSVGLNAWEDAH